jgi:hypothetical protein
MMLKYNLCGRGKNFCFDSSGNIKKYPRDYCVLKGSRSECTDCLSLDSREFEKSEGLAFEKRREVNQMSMVKDVFGVYNGRQDMTYCSHQLAKVLNIDCNNPIIGSSLSRALCYLKNRGLITVVKKDGCEGSNKKHSHYKFLRVVPLRAYTPKAKRPKAETQETTKKKTKLKEQLSLVYCPACGVDIQEFLNK